MTNRHNIARHRIAPQNGVLVSAPVELDVSIDAAIAAEAAKAGVVIDRDDVATTVVYLSDVRYTDLLVAHRSGERGHLGTADGEYTYAYDVEDADKEADTFLKRKGEDMGRMLFNFEIESQFSGNIANDFSWPLRNGTLPTSEVLEMRQALELRPQIEEFVNAFIDGCNAQPDVDDVLNDLDELHLLPAYDFWMSDPFVVAAAALAVEVISNTDATDEEALKERDEDLILVGRDPSRNHQLQIGREIDERGTFDTVTYLPDYRSVIAWAKNDRNHNGTWVA